MYNLCAASESVYREASCVAEHVEQLAPFGIFLKQRTVLALVNEESGLLSAKPVDMELQAVLC